MDSGTIGDSNDDVNWRGRFQWPEDSKVKVYKRRIHRKAQKTSSKNGTTTTTASNAGRPGSGATTTENPTSASVPTQVSTPAVASTTTAEVSPTSTSKDADDSAAAPTPSATPGGDKATGAHHENAGDAVVPESLETLAVDDADLCPQRAGEQSLHQEHSSSLPQPQSCEEAQERRGSPNADLQNREDSPLARSNGAKNSDDVPQNLRGSSPLSGQNGFPNGNGLANVDGSVKPLVISKVDDRVRFKLAKAPRKDEIKVLREKLESELHQVSRLVKEIEAKELQLASYNASQIRNSSLSNNGSFVGTEDGTIGGHSYPQPQQARTDVVDRRVLVRASMDMGVVGHHEIRPTMLARVNSDLGAARIEPRPYSRQLSVAVMENNHRVGEYAEKEKRTPKANQYYRNSEFLLGKDRLPSESAKRMKTNNGRKHSGDTAHSFRVGFGLDKSRNQLFKSCSSLLQRLMKHKHGWVFNEPVNAKALGLVDYHDIIKHPMDLGTIKTRLSQNWYKSPKEFAEDVRLVFRNAMTYNPKGQDVHIMAEQLSQIFEERWAIIEAEYNPYWKYQVHPQSQFAPVSDVPVPLYAPAAAQLRTLDRPEMMTTSMAVDPKAQRSHVGRTPVPKKPKAKDPDKRDMTYDEKQRLSANLQSLPSEKLDAIVQIIKKRNTALSQNDDEIEVDIDNVDAETLWELDRFVTNYKKSLSKNKRKAELALQARAAANQTVALMNTTTAVADGRIDSETALGKKTVRPAVEGEKQGYNNRSSSSSSSSSDSGSSSSDSDSDSSSANGSDAGHSAGA